MRFLVDECTGPSVALWLQEQGHEVFSVYKEVRGATDEEVIDKAYSENWILITNDKDFGEKVFRERRPYRGVILLRLEDERAVARVAAVSRLLDNCADRVPDSFTVVSETKVRFASGSE